MNQFFHSRKRFTNYSRILQDVIAASDVSILGSQGEVSIPPGVRMVIEAYHAPHFSSNILSVGLLSLDFIVAFSDDIRPCSA